MNKSSAMDIVSIFVCALIWGTTWYAITLQFGAVDPIVSVFYRFTLAALVLFAFGLMRGEPMFLAPRQQLPVLGVGFFTFAGNYPLVYLAEERITSAVVAVAFAGHALCNTMLFRFTLGERAPLSTWLGAMLGAFGVALASWNELLDADMDKAAQVGLALSVAAVVGAAFGNLFARKSQLSGAPVIASTAWAMAYGALMLAVFIAFSGRHLAFDARPAYVLSLIYLAVFGSVVAFVLYFSLAQRRGFALASYVSALTPITAMVVSALFEGKDWGFMALAGIGVVLIGQWVMLRPIRTLK